MHRCDPTLYALHPGGIAVISETTMKSESSDHVSDILTRILTLHLFKRIADFIDSDPDSHFDLHLHRIVVIRSPFISCPESAKHHFGSNPDSDSDPNLYPTFVIRILTLTLP